MTGETEILGGNRLSSTLFTTNPTLPKAVHRRCVGIAVRLWIGRTRNWDSNPSRGRSPYPIKLNLNSGGWSPIGSTRHCGHQWPTALARGDYDDGEIGGMIDRTDGSTRRKPAPVPLCPPQTPDAARTRTGAAAVGSQRLTAWATARPNYPIGGTWCSLPGVKWRDWGTPRKTSARRVCVPIEIRTEYLSRVKLRKNPVPVLFRPPWNSIDASVYCLSYAMALCYATMYVSSPWWQTQSNAK
jgi:hypothetical protein